MGTDPYVNGRGGAVFEPLRNAEIAAKSADYMQRFEERKKRIEAYARNKLIAVPNSSADEQEESSSGAGRQRRRRNRRGIRFATNSGDGPVEKPRASAEDRALIHRFLGTEATQQLREARQRAKEATTQNEQTAEDVKIRGGVLANFGIDRFGTDAIVMLLVAMASI